MPTKPEYIGDIYKVTGYPADGLISYGWAYKDRHPGEASKWCWWLEMSDGDFYPWSGEMPEMLLDSIELVRRNPLRYPSASHMRKGA